MTVWQSNALLANSQLVPATTGGYRSMMHHGYADNLKSLYFEINNTAAILTTDTIEFGMVPNGFRLLGGVLKAADIGAATSVLNVGDAGSATRIFSANTVIQAGGVVSVVLATAIGFKYTADTLITGTITVASGDAAGAPGLQLALWGILEGFAS